jgi:hypothetical protein
VRVRADGSTALYVESSTTGAITLLPANIVSGAWTITAQMASDPGGGTYNIGELAVARGGPRLMCP